MIARKKFDSTDLQGISTFLHEHGYCVIAPEDDSVETFRAVAGRFGLIQFHTKSDETGVVGGGDPINKDWQAFRDDYHGELSSDFHPHTDGSFLNGMAYVDGVAKKITPPKYVILQCVSRPQFGGDNFLVDGQRIYNDLLLNRPDILKILMTSGSVTYCRDDLLSIDCSVFEKVNEDTLRIATVMTVLPSAQPGRVPLSSISRTTIQATRITSPTLAWRPAKSWSWITCESCMHATSSLTVT